jgi:hypothetical protein
MEAAGQMLHCQQDLEAYLYSNCTSVYLQEVAVQAMSAKLTVTQTGHSCIVIIKLFKRSEEATVTIILMSMLKSRRESLDWTWESSSWYSHG